MRLLFSIIITTISLSLHAEGNEALRYWHVTGSSSLEIIGTTNVNSFICASAYSKGKDVITERWNPENGTWEIFGTVFLDVEGFDCKNRIMNNDFQNTLQADEHPEIKVEFINLKEVDSGGNNRKAEGTVKITLAGTTQQYPIVSNLEFIDDEFSILTGEKVFRFSDFGLEAPQKGFGLVRVRDEIKVSFELMLDQVLLTDL